MAGREQPLQVSETRDEEVYSPSKDGADKDTLKDERHPSDATSPQGQGTPPPPPPQTHLQPQPPTQPQPQPQPQPGPSFAKLPEEHPNVSPDLRPTPNLVHEVPSTPSSKQPTATEAAEDPSFGERLLHIASEELQSRIFKNRSGKDNSPASHGEAALGLLEKGLDSYFFKHSHQARPQAASERVPVPVPSTSGPETTPGAHGITPEDFENELYGLATEEARARILRGDGNKNHEAMFRLVTDEIKHYLPLHLGGRHGKGKEIPEKELPKEPDQGQHEQPVSPSDERTSSIAGPGTVFKGPDAIGVGVEEGDHMQSRVKVAGSVTFAPVSHPEQRLESEYPRLRSPPPVAQYPTNFNSGTPTPPIASTSRVKQPSIIPLTYGPDSSHTQPVYAQIRDLVPPQAALIGQQAQSVHGINSLARSVGSRYDVPSEGHEQFAQHGSFMYSDPGAQGVGVVPSTGDTRSHGMLGNERRWLGQPRASGGVVGTGSQANGNSHDSTTTAYNPESNNRPPPAPGSVEYRLKPTLDLAKIELKKYQFKTNLMSYGINVALALQLIVGALITGVAAAASPRGGQISTSILGGLSTVIAGFLARMRGSGEPEISRDRAASLEEFVHIGTLMVQDHGFECPDPLSNNQHDQNLLKQVKNYRDQYYVLINGWRDKDSGEKKHSTQKGMADESKV